MSEQVGSAHIDIDAKTDGVERGAKVAEKSLKDVENQAKNTESASKQLSQGLKMLGGALGALKLGQMLVGEMRRSVEVANETNRVMAQTQAVVRSTGMAAGLSAQQIKEMANEIQRTTAVSDDAAQTGMNMLLTFTNIGQEVFPRATDALLDLATAMAGGAIPTTEQLRTTAIQLGVALNDPIQGVSRLRRAGVQLTDQQTQMVEHFVEVGDVAKAQGIILDELSNQFGGSAAAQAQTYEGQLAMVTNSLDDMRKLIGNAILPAVTFLTGSFQNAGVTGGALISVVRVLSSVFIGFISIARQVGIALTTVGTALFAALSGDMRLAQNVVRVGFQDMADEAKRAQESISRVYNNEIKGQTGIVLSGLDDQVDAHDEAGQKIRDQIAKQTEEFERSQAKRNLTFKRRLAELVWAHQDKANSLKDDLQSETRSFRDSMEERTRKFRESMFDMEEAHLRKTEELAKQLDREEQKQEEKVNKALEDGRSQLEEEEKLFKQKEKIIESQIESELSKGERASQSALATLRIRLENERQIHKLKVGEIKDQIDEETQKAVDANKDRIEDLQDRLSQEQSDYKKEQDKRELTFEEETAKLKVEHGERISDLTDRLKKEEGVLSKHADSVEAIKDQSRLDDITGLKRQHSEQKAEEEANHQRRIADIANQGNQAGKIMGDNFLEGLKGTQPALSGLANNIGEDTMKSVGAGSRKESFNQGKSSLGLFIDGMGWSAKNRSGEFAGMIGSIFGGLKRKSGGGGSWGNLPFFADGVSNFGGGMAVVGERGPEIVRLPRGSDVIPNEQAFGGGGNATINIGQVNERSDVDMITRELGFRSSLRV